MIGVELPDAGRGVFQVTFSDGLKRVGSWESLLTPIPPLPRQAGQFSAIATVARKQIATMTGKEIRLILKVSNWWDAMKSAACAWIILAKLEREIANAVHRVKATPGLTFHSNWVAFFQDRMNSRSTELVLNTIYLMGQEKLPHRKTG